MRVMVMIKANEASEAGQLPNTEVIASMHAYNESLMKAGILLDGDGLKPSSQGRRISNRGGKPHVTDGPFAETKELIAGFWVWEVSSMEEAIEWAKRCPAVNQSEEYAELELRPFFEMEDFDENFTPELREKEAAMREELEQKKSS